MSGATGGVRAPVALATDVGFATGVTLAARAAGADL